MYETAGGELRSKVGTVMTGGMPYPQVRVDVFAHAMVTMSRNNWFQGLD
jgi:hypothetical protein